MTRKVLNPRVLLYLWIFGFAVSFVMQSVLQSWFAEHSYWGASRGWQNEIAIWNVGMIAVLLGAAGNRSAAAARVLPGLALLSTFFAINHIAALIVSPTSLSHMLGASGNVVGVTLYGVYLLSHRH